MALLPFMAAACAEIDPGGLSLELSPGTVPADGRTQVTVTVCNLATEKKPSVEVTLEASSGTWLDAGGDKRAATAVLTDDAPCRDSAWVPGDEATTVQFRAKVGTELLAEKQLTVTPFGGIEISLKRVGEEVVGADGVNGANIEACLVTDGLKEVLALTLRASAGAWQFARPETPGTIEVPIGPVPGCIRESWVASTTAGPVRFQALLGDHSAGTLDLTTVPAVVNEIQLVPEPPVLNGEGTTSVRLTVDLRTATGGHASNGTPVHFEIAGSSPDNVAVLDRTTIRVGEIESAVLLVAEGAAWVAIRAAVDGKDGPLSHCRVLAPLGTSSVPGACGD